MPRKAVRRSASESCARAAQGASPAQGQRQKPKTVSELLREKRLRESQAKKAMQRTVLVTSPVLVSGPLIIQHPPQQIIPSAQAGSIPAAAAGTESQALGSPVPTRTPAAGSASVLVPQNHSSTMPETGDNPGCTKGTDLQSSKKLKEEVLESSPEGGDSPGVNPAAAEKAPDQGGCNAQVPASSSASAVQQNQALVPQQTPVSLLPALVPPPAASPVIPNNILPFKWVVIPQVLLPSAVQTVVGVPQGVPAAAGESQRQTNVTSNGKESALEGTLVPAGSKPPQPSSAGTKGPNSQLARVPLGKAADQSTVLSPLTSVCPGSTTSSVSVVTPECSDGSSMAPDSSAAPAAPPAASPAPCATVLPQTEPPASAQGSDSQPVPSLPSLGRSSDSVTTNGSSFSPGSMRTEPVPWPAAAAPHSNGPGNSDCSGAQEQRSRPVASKPPSADVPPQPSTSSAEKNLLDFSLISLEDEGLVKEWLTGKQGVQVPSLQTRLPYLPPFLCSIKTLSKLLVQKAALEEQAASLLPSEAGGDGGTGDVFHAIGELVQQKLGDNPAYLLLKARFLAAFTLPAVLATLPPPKMKTTLSASRKQHEDSDDEEWQSKEKVSERESCGNELTGAQEDWRHEDEPGDKDADLLNQVKQIPGA